jgi:hypothetical protein
LEKKYEAPIIMGHEMEARGMETKHWIGEGG